MNLLSRTVDVGLVYYFIVFLESGLLSQMDKLVSLSLSVLLSGEGVSWVLLHEFQFSSCLV